MNYVVDLSSLDKCRRLEFLSFIIDSIMTH